MNPATDITTATTTTAAAAAAPAATGRREAGHPLIWAAVLVWLSVEAIGDGLLAMRSLLASATTQRSTTPTVTPS